MLTSPTTHVKMQYNCPNEAKNNGWVSIYNISNMNIYELDLKNKLQVKREKACSMALVRQ